MLSLKTQKYYNFNKQYSAYLPKTPAPPTTTQSLHLVHKDPQIYLAVEPLFKIVNYVGPC